MTGTYEIRVRERLDGGWASRFDDFCVSHEEDGTTLLVGSVADQAALHGLLMKVRDLGLTLLSVVRVGPGQRWERFTRTELGLLLGVCGLYCGACYHYRAAFPEGRHLLEQAARQGRKLEGFTCRGCRSDALYIHPGCAQCEIRACADGKGVAHCGLCPEFPCGRIQAFQCDGRVHHRDVLIHLQELAAKGPDRWLAQQVRRWTCGCGAAFTWYEVSCSRCGAPLPSYGPDPKEVARMDTDAVPDARPRHWQTAPELPPEVFEAWRKPNGAISPVAVIATVDPDGTPRTAPFGSLQAVTPRLLRLCSWRGHDTYANLCRGGRVSVALISPDVAVSVCGRARVVREQMDLDEQFAALEVDVEEVKNDMVYRIVVESGIEIAAKEEYKPWYDAVMAELEAMG